MSGSATETEGDPNPHSASDAPEWPPNRLPLATITPESAVAQPAFVEGVATLLWPFSQSSSTFAVLVCEEDFRLRNNKGQLKVNFRGAVAKEMKNKLQIGNKLQLSLEDAELEELSDPTPRDVPWALKYSHRLRAKVKTDMGESYVDIEDREPTPVPLASTINDTFEDEDTFDSAVQTPPRRHTIHSQPSENEWHTSGTQKRSLDNITSSPLIPQGFFGDTTDLFAEEYPRKRPRFSSSFRIVERSPSPEIPEDASKAIEVLNRAITESRRGTIMEEGPLVPDMSAIEDMSALEDMPAIEDVPLMQDEMNGQPSFGDMFPPPLPELSTQFSGSEDNNTEMPDSPSLRPVPSPSLPLVSPFIHKELPGSDYMSMDVDNQALDEEGAQIGLNQDALELLSFLTDSVPQQLPREDAPPNPMAQKEARSEITQSIEVHVKETVAELPQPEHREDVEREKQHEQEKRSAPESFASSDGEGSERDSLFDDQSDSEHHVRPRSKSPLPGPSPLRKMIPAKPESPEESPKKASKLSIRAGFTPVNDKHVSLDTPLKTPHLYLPTPSPKVSLEGAGFPFSAPSKLDFSQRPIQELPDAAERRRLFRESRKSVPGGPSAYFGQPVRRSSLDTDARLLPTLPTPASAEEPPPRSPLEEKVGKPREGDRLEEQGRTEVKERDEEGYASDDEKAEDEKPEDEYDEVLDGSGEEKGNDRRSEHKGEGEEEQDEEQDEDEKMEEQIHELEETLEEELQHDEEMEDVEEESEEAVDQVAAETDEEMEDAVVAEESDIEDAVDQIPVEPQSDSASPEPRRPLVVDEFEDDYDEEEYDGEDDGLEGELESGDEEGSYDEYEYEQSSARNDDDLVDEEDWDEESDREHKQQPLGFIPGQVIDLISDDEDEDDEEDQEPAKAEPEHPTEIEEPESEETSASSAAASPEAAEDKPETHRTGGPEVVTASPSSPVPASGSIPETPNPDTQAPAPFKSGITTSLSDFPALAFLSWGSVVDVIGVVTQATPIAQAKAGQKDYYNAMRIVDSSCKPGIVIRVFRPFEKALPMVAPGDVVILRAFEIVSQKHKLMGKSTENSAWAVWKADEGEAEPVCAGPPLEYGDEERGYVKAIGKWYRQLPEKERETMEGKSKEDLTAGIQ